MINTTRLRLLLGWLGIALPWVVAAVVGYIPESISATYYTNAQAVFMIVLGSSAFLLASYLGYDKADDLISTISGISALLICLFPCAVSNPGSISGTFPLSMRTNHTVHCASAVAFFLSLAYMSLFQFTKTSGNMTPSKKKRNVLYVICGVGMLLCMALIPLNNVIHWSKMTWFVEMIALLFFGLSWLTKANVYKWLFADK